MKAFTKETIENFLKWCDSLNKEQIYNDFLEEDEDINTDILIKLNINDIIDDDNFIYSNNKIKLIEDFISYILKFNYVDLELNPNIVDEDDYNPEEAIYCIDVYFENKESGFILKYGTYDISGFDEKYEIIKESW